MKEAIPFGNMEITGVDAVARLKWERKLLKELYPLHSAYPKILDEFTCDNVLMKFEEL